MNKLVLITMVKNECDIIESFIRHHLNIVDTILVVDHNSCDSTNLILQSLKSEGLPIHICKDTRVEKAQDIIMTNLMYRAVKEFYADIVLPIDADEFLVSSPDKKNCRKLLQELDTNSVHIVDSFNYFPSSLDDETEKFILWRSSLRSSIKQNLSKVIVGREIIEKFHISLEMGSHNIGVSRRKRKLITHCQCSDIHIAHIQVRSKNQFISKIAVGWIAGSARPGRKPSDSIHLKNSFNKLKAGLDLDYHEMINTISDLHIDENSIEPSLTKKISQHAEIKYSSLISINPMVNILNIGESIAINYANAIKRESNIPFLIKRIAISILDLIKLIYYRKIRGITNW